MGLRRERMLEGSTRTLPAATLHPALPMCAGKRSSVTSGIPGCLSPVLRIFPALARPRLAAVLGPSHTPSLARRLGPICGMKAKMMKVRTVPSTADISRPIPAATPAVGSNATAALLGVPLVL